MAASPGGLLESNRRARRPRGRREHAVNIVSATQGEDNLRKEFFGLVVQGSQLSH